MFPLPAKLESPFWERIPQHRRLPPLLPQFSLFLFEQAEPKTPSKNE